MGPPTVAPDFVKTVHPFSFGPAEYFALTVGVLVLLAMLNFPALKWLAKYPGRRLQRLEAKEFKERQRVIEVMRETENLMSVFMGSRSGHRGLPTRPEALTKIEIAMEELTELGLVPDQDVSAKVIAARLNSLIPYVEKYGIKRAAEVARSRYGKQEESIEVDLS